MKIRYEESFARDLKLVKDKKLLRRLKEILHEISNAEDLRSIRNIK